MTITGSSFSGCGGGIYALLGQVLIQSSIGGSVDTTDGTATLTIQGGEFSGSSNALFTIGVGQAAWHQLHTPTVADQLRKLPSQVQLDMLGIIRVENAIMRWMKIDDEGHDLAQMHRSCTLLPDFSATKLFPSSCLRVCLAKIID